MEKKTYKIDLGKLVKKILEKYDTPAKSMEFFTKKNVQEYFGIMNIGYCKFSLRKADATASVSVSKELKTNDFGVSSEDQISILELIMNKINKDRTLKDLENLDSKKHFPIFANKLAELDGQDADQDLSNYTPKEIIVKEIKKEPAYKARYLSGRKDNRKRNPKTFDTLMDGLCRSCSKKEKDRAEKIFDIGLVDYFRKDKNGNIPKNPEKVFRLFIPEYDKNLDAYGSFSYNRSEEKKGLLRTNGKRVIFGIHLLPSFDKTKPIIFSEGHSDTVVNNAKRMQSITSGSAGMSIGKNIEDLKGLDIHFYPDLDLPGVEGLTKKLLEIEIFNKTASDIDKINYSVFYWSTKMIIDNEEVAFKSYEKEQGLLLKTFIDKDKRPFSTYLSTLLPNEKKTLWNRIKLSKWTPKSITPKQKGYDWIDFHTDNKDHEKYSKFVSQYTY